MTRARQWGEAAAAALVIALARIAPRRTLIALGGVFGAAAGRLDRRHAKIARDNLEQAYGSSLAAVDRERILRDCWRHFGRITFDALAFRGLSPGARDHGMTCFGEENIRAAYSAGKGVLVFSAHFGHWEAGALLLGHLGYPLAVVTRPLDNPILERLLARARRGTGNAVIHKRRAVREILKTLATGSGVAILIDQDAREDGVFVPYFGRPAATTPTLALLALRTGAPVLPVFTRMEPDGRIEVHAEPPVVVQPTEDREEDVVRFTAACTAIVESWVRREPAQWLWMHRRWKTLPPGALDGQVA